MGKYLLQPAVSEDPSVLLVTLLGVGVVFLGLTMLIGLVRLMNAFFNKKFDEKNALNQKTVGVKNEPVTTQPAATEQIENKQEILAAVCAAIAEENGTDISAIRVLSFKKL